MFDKIREYIKQLQEKLGSTFNGRMWVTNDAALQKNMLIAHKIVFRLQGHIMKNDLNDAGAIVTADMDAETGKKVLVILDNAIVKMSIGSNIEDPVKNAKNATDRLFVFTTFMRECGPIVCSCLMLYLVNFITKELDSSDTLKINDYLFYVVTKAIVDSSELEALHNEVTADKQDPPAAPPAEDKQDPPAAPPAEDKQDPPAAPPEGKKVTATRTNNKRNN